MTLIALNRLLALLMLDGLMTLWMLIWWLILVLLMLNRLLVLLLIQRTLLFISGILASGARLWGRSWLLCLLWCLLLLLLLDVYKCLGQQVGGDVDRLMMASGLVEIGRHGRGGNLRSNSESWLCEE